MKASDILPEANLNETPLDDEELATVGDRAARFLSTCYKRFNNDVSVSLSWNKTPYDEESENMPSMRLSKIFPRSKYKFGSSSLQQAINIVSLTAGAMGVHEMGFYSYKSELIIINADLLEDGDIEKTASVIVHELRHAMDRILSKNPDPIVDPDDPLTAKPNHQANYKKYLQSTTEVNARYSQVIASVRNFLLAHPAAKDLGSFDFSWFIKDQFNAAQMSEAFERGIADPRYQRLFKRTYLWMEKYYNDRLKLPGNVSKPSTDNQ
jgi:hypothetical protein